MHHSHSARNRANFLGASILVFGSGRYSGSSCWHRRQIALMVLDIRIRIPALRRMLVVGVDILGFVILVDFRYILVVFWDLVGQLPR